MKSLLSFLFVLSFSAVSAQSLMVGNTPLEDIDTDYLELRAVFLRPLNTTQLYSIQYGQECTRPVLQLLNRSYLTNCTGLQYADGTLVEGVHYAKALTLLNREGWELVDTILESSEGDSASLTDTVFLLKRKE